MTKAVFFARDPGAANQIVAVQELLDKKDEGGPAPARLAGLAGGRIETVSLRAAGPALTVYARAGLSASASGCPTAAEVAAADLLVTGTGDVDDWQTRTLWTQAAAAQVPVVVIMDSPDNVPMRFDLQDGGRFCPDLVLVHDEAMAKAVVEAVGTRAETLVVGNLHMNRLAQLGGGDAVKARANWNVAPHDVVALFVSETGREARAMGRHVPFDEIELLDAFLEQVRAGHRFPELGGESIVSAVVIRPHPRDSIGKYDRYAGRDNPRTIVSGVDDPNDAIRGADLVVGMTSALLPHAKLFGRPVRRLYPDPKG